VLTRVRDRQLALVVSGSARGRCLAVVRAPGEHASAMALPPHAADGLALTTGNDPF